MPFDEAAKFWNTRFDTHEYIFGTDANKYLTEKALKYFQKLQKVLCVADGEGRNSIWLASQGMDVDAFDISDIAIKKANELAIQFGVSVRLYLKNTDEWDWKPNQYDGVVAIFVQFADPEMRVRLFRNMIHALKAGGVLILLGYSPKQLEYKTGGPSLLEHLYTEKLLREQFSTYAEILEIESWEEELSEGRRHSGMSALVGMVARKL